LEPVTLQNSPPEAAQPAPDFRLKGPGGTFSTLSENLGKPVVLVFYPLAFSPVCSHQLPEFQAVIARFEDAGAVVYGVSVDSHWSNTAFARSLGLTFPLLSDWKREASRAYGVLLEQSGYSGRATFVIGRDGRIVHREIAENTGMEHVPSLDAAIQAATRG